MPVRPFILDRYILRHMLGTMFAVLTVVMSLMILEHLPRLLELTRFSGHRGYIVMQTISGLLPEYGGIGLLVGLFLSIALTVRRLALRGELDVIEACGISPSRWMLFPFALATTVSLATMVNQGWLMPAGEIKLAEIGRRVEHGDFGHRLQAGELIDLGYGSVLEFQQVDASKRQLFGLFLRTGGNTVVARRGRIWRLPSGTVAVELHDGQVIQEQSARAVAFAHLEYRIDAGDGAPGEQPRAGLVRRADIQSLWADGTMPARSAFYGRCLWAALALLLPPLALILGKPARRQSGGGGILVGLIALVVGLKMIDPLLDGNLDAPELRAAGTLASWGLFVSGLIQAEKVFGHGYVDLATSRLVRLFHRPRA